MLNKPAVQIVAYAKTLTWIFCKTEILRLQHLLSHKESPLLWVCWDSIFTDYEKNYRGILCTCSAWLFLVTNLTKNDVVFTESLHIWHWPSSLIFKYHQKLESLAISGSASIFWCSKYQHNLLLLMQLRYYISFYWDPRSSVAAGFFQKQKMSQIMYKAV